MTDSEEIQKLKGQVELLKDLLEKEISKNRNCCNGCSHWHTYTYPYYPTITYPNTPYSGGQSSGQSYGGGGGCSTYNNNIKRQQDL